MLPEKKKEIDGMKFGVTPFMAGEALRLQSQLLKLFGPSFGAAIGAFKKGTTDIDGDALANALMFLFNQFSDEEVLFNLIKRMMKNVVVEFTDDNGLVVLFDFAESYESRLTIVFQGKLLTIYKVILFVLEVNYPDFFDKVKGFFGDRTLPTILSPKGEVSDDPTSSK